MAAFEQPGEMIPASSLTVAQEEMADRIRRRWERAFALARAHPEHDASDLYHALRCFELTPAERLRAGLQRGRLRTHAR
jgi:hypothetical protein